VHSLTRFALRHPASSAALILALTGVSVVGALRIETRAGFRAYVGADHPAVRRLDAFIARFGGGLPVAIVWSCARAAACQSVFDAASLEMAHAVSTALERTAGVRSVQGPATSPLLVPTPDGFAVRSFVEEGRPVADREALARRAVIDPLWRGALVSTDAKVGAIVFELASSESDLNIGVMQELQKILRPFEARGFEFNLVGDPVEFVVAGDALRRDSIRLVPVIVGLIAAVLFALFRSWRAVAICLGSVGLAVVWALGVMGWLGWPQTAVSQALAPFILTVGVCSAIHLLSRYATDGAEHELQSREETLLGVVRDVGPACLLASLTTAAGFASFATSGAASFAQFGMTAAVGVLGGLVLSFTLLPILLVRLDPRGLFAPRVSDAWIGSLSALVEGAQRRAGLILLATAGVAALSLLGMRSLQADVSVSSLFGEETRVVRWLRFVREHLRELASLDVVLELPDGTRVAEPSVLSRIDDLATGMAKAYGSGSPASLLVPLSWANRLVHDDSPAFQRPGGSERANAELLLLLSMHEPGALDRWLSLDRRYVRVSLAGERPSYAQVAKRLGAVRAYLRSALPHGWHAELSGPVSARFHMVDEVQRTQLRSFVTATGVVFLLVAVFFRSFPWALAAMVPTLLPVLVTLGVMGAWGIYLDMGTAMVAAVVLGIAIDDTIHLLVQYRRRRRKGAAAPQAMREASLHVGRGVVTTSVALALGFFVLTLSSWQSVASFGFLSGLAILGAMGADLIVLPALVASIARLQERSISARRLWNA
jgi:predicted RND superfamily exporter protein